jgi:hypothetical protein
MFASSRLELYFWPGLAAVSFAFCKVVGLGYVCGFGMHLLFLIPYSSCPTLPSEHAEDEKMLLH